MGDSDVCERAGRSDRTGRPEFDLIASKIRRPVMRTLAGHPPVVPGGRRGSVSVPKASRRRRPRSTASWGVSSRSQAVARARDLALLDR